jgi:hypothetical protein
MLSFRVFPSKASKYDWWDDNQTVDLQFKLNFPDELETYNKIIRVIKSCKHPSQLKTASIMVDRFYWLHCNAVSTEALNKKVALKLRSFRLRKLEE